ncbi:UNVERIFIED_CONTAM: hypothetical protein GTU68_006999 [Idotea baltica]|nr:hypothetical protein [Idotea baltica]
MAVGKSQDGRVVFVEGPVPGDVLDVKILRKKKGFFQGIPESYRSYSAERVEPACQHFEDCGGCKWQHLNYPAQLQEKERIVQDAMRRIAKVEVKNWSPILSAPASFFYRNKMEFSFSNQRWKTKSEVQNGDIITDSQEALGLHPPKFFNKVVQIEECLLMDSFCDQVRNFVGDYARKHQLEFYDPVKHTGFLRNMIIRNTTLGEWMLVLSFAYEDRERREALQEAVKMKFESISSFHYVINKKMNDTLFDQEMKLVAGKPYIEERFDNIHFKIRPKSFFQTNPVQAKHLYDIVKDFADLQKNEIVYDLYTGTGSIALYVAQNCGTIVGVEEVPDAIEDAKDNAEFNMISNAHFYVGDVKNVFTAELLERHGHPDCVITDPPRAGMHADVIHSLLSMRPAKIIYISCNPATQARDIQMLSADYSVEKMRPVDMFPHTNHIENVALLRRK